MGGIMARFILDVATQYDDKGKITTDIKKCID